MPQTARTTFFDAALALAATACVLRFFVPFTFVFVVVAVPQTLKSPPFSTSVVTPSGSSVSTNSPP